MAKLRIRYTKSAIGYSSRQKATIRSLGLGKLQSVVIHDDTPAIRGMAFHVRHLVTVEEIDESQIEQPKKRPATTIVLKASEQAEPVAPRLTPVTGPTVTLDEPASMATSVVQPAVASVEEPVAAMQPAVAPEEPAVAPVSVVATAATLAVESTDVSTSTPANLATEAYDLEIIEGIGPKIADRLREEGIHTFAQLAEADVATLEQILRSAKLYGGLTSVATWSEQARLATAGKWDELKQLQEQLNAGRDAGGDTE